MGNEFKHLERDGKSYLANVSEELTPNDIYIYMYIYQWQRVMFNVSGTLLLHTFNKQKKFFL